MRASKSAVRRKIAANRVLTSKLSLPGSTAADAEEVMLLMLENLVLLGLLSEAVEDADIEIEVPDDTNLHIPDEVWEDIEEELDKMEQEGFETIPSPTPFG